MYPGGRGCISILHTPGEDPLGYESATERWSPVQSIEKILLSVVSMLAGMSSHDEVGSCGEEVGSCGGWSYCIVCPEPNDESGANVDASVRVW